MDDPNIRRLQAKVKQYDDRISVHTRRIKDLAIQQAQYQKRLESELRKKSVNSIAK